MSKEGKETTQFFSWRQAILASDLNSNNKLVALVISTFMNDWGHGAWPSQEMIAKRASLSERGVRKAVKELEELGWLYRAKARLPGKQWARTSYAISFPPMFEDSLEGAAQGAGSQNDGLKAPCDGATEDGFEGAARGAGIDAEPDAGRDEGAAQDSCCAAEGPAKSDEGPAKIDSKDRHVVPTNSPENSPENSPAVLGPHTTEDDWRCWSPSPAQEIQFRMAGFSYTPEELQDFRIDLAGLERRPFSITTAFRTFVTKRRNGLLGGGGGPNDLESRNRRATQEFLKKREGTSGN